MDSIFVREMAAEGFESNSLSPNSLADSYDVLGMPTPLNSYLAKSAMQMGLNLSGVIKFSDYSSLYEDLVSDDQLIYAGPSEFENYILAYQNMTINYFHNFYELTGSDVFELEQRIQIFANEIFSNHQRHPLFFVIGIGHLVGENSIFSKLKKMGVEIRNLGKGEPSDKIEEYYHSTEYEKEWSKISGQKYPFALISVNQVPTFFEGDFAEAHVSYSSMEGLGYMTMVIPDPKMELDSMFNVLSDSFSKRGKERQVDIRTVGERDVYATTVIDSIAYSINMFKENNYLIFQMIVGISQKAMSSPTIDKYISGIKIVEQGVSEWTLDTTKVGMMQYYFLENSLYRNFHEQKRICGLWRY